VSGEYFYGHPGEPPYAPGDPSGRVIGLLKAIANAVAAVGGAVVDVVDRAGRLLGIVRIQDTAGNALTSTGNDLDVYAPDGGIVSIGATTDAEAAAGNGSEIALLKRLRTLLNGGLPAALGQGTMAQSLAVVVASDQSPFGIIDRRVIGASAAHYTITGLHGPGQPLPAAAAWLANPSYRTRCRFDLYANIRGMTALNDDPQLTVRPWYRTGGAGGESRGGAGVALMSLRAKDDATLVRLQKTTDNGANYTDYSAVVNDNSAATEAVLDALDTVANGDWLVAGSPSGRFTRLPVDMDAANVNANASVLTVEYWNGAAWVAVANMVDGTTVAAGKTMSGDGQITWTDPGVGWVQSAINGITAYWVRLSVSAALSANVKMEELDIGFPISRAIDAQADGEDTMLRIESQDIAMTGTIAYSGTVRYSWR